MGTVTVVDDDDAGEKEEVGDRLLVVVGCKNGTMALTGMGACETNGADVVLVVVG